MSAAWYKRIIIACAVLALVFVAVLAGSGSRSSEEPIDETIRERLEESFGSDGASEAASAIQEIESSRQQVIEDSIQASIEESLAAVSEGVEDLQSDYEEAASNLADVNASIDAAMVEISERREQGEDEALLQSEEAALRDELANAQQGFEEAGVAVSSAEEILQSEAQAAEVEVEPVDNRVTILFGDSRTYAFEAYNVWPADQVFYMIEQVEVHYDMLQQAANQNPKNIIFGNGVDDMISNGVEGALANYEPYIRRFQELSPNTHIYVQAVLPVYNPGIQRFPVLAETGRYNELIFDMCQRNGWTYVDASQGYSEACAYGDGIHFSSAWTERWLQNLRTSIGF